MIPKIGPTAGLDQASAASADRGRIAAFPTPVTAPRSRSASPPPAIYRDKSAYFGNPAARLTRVPARALLSDNDGVLADSEPAVATSVIETLNANGFALTPAQQHEIRDRTVGTSLTTMQPILRDITGRDVPARFEAEAAPRILHHLQFVQPMPGAVAMLRHAQAQGYAVRIVTNSTAQEMAIKAQATGIAALVPADRCHTAGGDTLPKPAPDPYLAGAKAAGCTPAECLTLEDSGAGMTSTVAAGAVSIGFDPTGQNTEKLYAIGARLVVNSHPEMMEVLSREIRHPALRDDVANAA